MASTPNFKISPGMLSGQTDIFLPIIDNRFLIMLMLTVKVFLILLVEFPGYYHNWIERNNKSLWGWPSLMDL